MQADLGGSPKHQRQDHRTRPSPNQEASLLRSQVAPRAQGCSLSLRDSHPPALDRHPVPDGADDRFAHAARSPGRRRCGSEALIFPELKQFGFILCSSGGCLYVEGLNSKVELMLRRD